MGSNLIIPSILNSNFILKNSTSAEDDGKAALAKTQELGINGTEGYRYFLAKLVINKPDGVKLVCSGTLINAKFILTAAHCLCDTFLKCGEVSWSFGANKKYFSVHL